MKKIIIEKNDGVAEVIDRILNEPDSAITLVVPNGSVLGKSMRSFNLLRREIEDAGRTLTIESVDENILAFAKASGITSTHPLWSGSRSTGGFSDILPEEDEAIEAIDEEPEPVRKKMPIKKSRKAMPSVRIAIHEEEEEAAVEDEAPEDQEEKEYQEVAAADEKEKKNFFSVGTRFFQETPIAVTYDEAPEHRGVVKKVIGCVVLGIVVIGAIFFAIPQFLGSAKITIDFKKTSWEYQHAFTADKAVSKIDTVNDILPAQMFTSSKNITQLFAASGNANVSIKARGTITIYNAYSSAAQTLVATTRFATPDGKIFRLVSGVTVPGAAITNGQIVPSSIDAPIIADQPGDSYNVGPVAKLTVTGFQGSAKYDGFYGAIASSTSGGFVGNKAVPTANDIASAKAKITAVLQSAFQSGGQVSYPANFKILDGATSVQIAKLTVNTSTDANGNFSVFGEAVFQAIGFDESGLKAFLLTLAQSSLSSSTFSSLDMNYSGTQPNFTTGTVSFSLDAQGMLEPAFSADDFRSTILGENIADARSTIAALPQLADGSISVWPAWLWKIPTNANKVQISAN